MSEKRVAKEIVEAVRGEFRHHLDAKDATIAELRMQITNLGATHDSLVAQLAEAAREYAEKAGESADCIAELREENARMRELVEVQGEGLRGTNRFLHENVHSQEDRALVHKRLVGIAAFKAYRAEQSNPAPTQVSEPLR